jgi:undecaprenyl-diphosphatase
LGEILAAAVLGVIQGLTEFLPISSSAHLILVPWIFGWQPEGIIFDVALHVGTAVAVLAYFFRTWVTLAVETVKGLTERAPLANAQRRLAWHLIVGTTPAALIGLAFEGLIEEKLRSPLVPVGTLVAFGIVLYAAEKRSLQTRKIEDLGFADAIWIGLSQALALIPGVSRSGITMSTAMLRNTDRFSAARFSFLLSTPIIVGAGLLEALRLATGGLGATHQPGFAPEWAVLAVGTASAAATGFLCIRYFLRYLLTNSFLPFVVYRFGLAIVVLVYYLRYRP